MRAQPNISASAQVPCFLPVYLDMQIVLTESDLPPRIVRGAAAEVVDIALHPMEPAVAQRPAIASQASVVLHYMPKFVYMRVRDCKDLFLGTTIDAAP